MRGALCCEASLYFEAPSDEAQAFLVFDLMHEQVGIVIDCWVQVDRSADWQTYHHPGTGTCSEFKIHGFS
ncbi:hypothetical protein D3C81_2256940 [compost metagenome]